MYHSARYGLTCCVSNVPVLFFKNITRIPFVFHNNVSYLASTNEDTFVVFIQIFRLVR